MVREISCGHIRISPGLDAICCKDCGKWWQSWQPEYERLLNQDHQCQQFPVLKMRAALVRVNWCVVKDIYKRLPSFLEVYIGCQHCWTTTWNSALKLINYCDRCHQSQPVTDASTLEQYRYLAEKVLAEYEQEHRNSAKPSRKREFEEACASLKQQLQYLDQQLGNQDHPDLNLALPPQLLEVPSRRMLLRGDRVFHLAWKRHGIIYAPITPNWVVRFDPGDFVVAPDELQRDIDTPEADPDDPEPSEISLCKNDEHRSASQELQRDIDTPEADPDDPELSEISLCKNDEHRSASQELQRDIDTPEADPDDPELSEISLCKNDEHRSASQELQRDIDTPEADLDNPEPSEISLCKKRRYKGHGSGSISWQTITRNGREYRQPWYQYEFWEKGKCTIKSSKYIPKKLFKKVQQLNEDKAPVREILKLLSGDKRI